MSRDDFPERTKEMLATRVVLRCPKPDCRVPTAGPNTEPGRAVGIGVAAHICAAAKGGPRHDLSITNEQRSAPDNEIWLCQNDAKLIDSDESAFPVALLRKWKEIPEAGAERAVSRVVYDSEGDTWKARARLQKQADATERVSAAALKVLDALRMITSPFQTRREKRVNLATGVG